MPRVPREKIVHTLKVRPDAKPIKQRLFRFAQGRKDAIRKEITRLLIAKFIREVYHLDWLANSLLVPKKNIILGDVCRLHRSQQGLPKGAVCAPLHRPCCSLNSRVRAALFPQRILWLPPDSASSWRSNQDVLHQPLWCLLLDNYAFCTSEHERELPTWYVTLSWFLDRSEHRGLHRWCGCEVSKSWGSHLWLDRDHQKPEELHDEAKSLKVRLWGLVGEAARIPHLISRFGVRGLPFLRLLKKHDKFIWT